MSDEPVCTCSFGYRCDLCREIDHVYHQAERRRAAEEEAVEFVEQKRLAPGVLAAIRAHLPTEMARAAERVLRSRDGAGCLTALLWAEEAVQRGEAIDVLEEADAQNALWRGLAS